MQYVAGAMGGELPFATFQRMVGLQDAASNQIVVDHFGEEVRSRRTPGPRPVRAHSATSRSRRV